MVTTDAFLSSSGPDASTYPLYGPEIERNFELIEGQGERR
jgi:hypothetical protein